MKPDSNGGDTDETRSALGSQYRWGKGYIVGPSRTFSEYSVKNKETSMAFHQVVEEILGRTHRQ